MSERDLPRIGLEPLTPAPANLHCYPSAPADDDDRPVDADHALRRDELRERLRHEQQDEPRYRSWEDRAADDAGVRRWGEL